MKLHRATIYLVSCLLGSCIATVVVPASADEATVFFLGVDHHDAGAAGATLAESVGQAKDRWALSNLGRELLQASGNQAIVYDLSNWRPIEDPFNVGVVLLRDLDFSTEGTPELGYRNHVSVELLWVHVGQDRLTRGEAKPFPEIRATVPFHYTAPQKSKALLTPEVKARFIEKTLKEGLQGLFKRLQEHTTRIANRKATELRYISVEPKVNVDRVRQHLLAIESAPEAARLSEELQLQLGRFIEFSVLEQLHSQPVYDNLVILAGRRLLATVRAFWPTYVNRVFSASPNSGARRILGQNPPRMLSVQPLCEDTAERDIRWVEGLEIRSAISSFFVDKTALNPYAYRYELRMAAAATVKLPLTATRSVVLSDAQGNLTATSTIELKRHAALDQGQVVNAHGLTSLTRDLADKLSDPLLGRIIESSKEPFNHPEYRELCNES